MLKKCLPLTALTRKRGFLLRGQESNPAGAGCNADFHRLFGSKTIGLCVAADRYGAFKGTSQP